MDDVTAGYTTADEDDEKGLRSIQTPGTRDPRTMSAAAFKLARLLTPEERTALARRPRFYSMPWLQLVTDDGMRDANADDLPR